MATHRVVPGTNLPESGSSTGPTSQSGSAPGSVTNGVGGGAPDTTSGSRHTSESRSTREFPRAAGVMDQVKQQASTRVNEQKVRAADGLGSVASAIRQAGEHLRAENQTLASYADTAVDQIQLFADRLRDKDPAEMVRDAQRFARRNPAAFVGGAFVLGLAMARFLKSSGSDAPDDTREFGRDDEDFGGMRGTRPFAHSDEVGSARSTAVSRTTDLPGSIGSNSTTDPTPGLTS